MFGPTICPHPCAVLTEPKQPWDGCGKSVAHSAISPWSLPPACESPARRPRAPARMSARLTGGCRFRGMHDEWPWGPFRRSWRLGAALPRRNHSGLREVPLGPRPRTGFAPSIRVISSWLAAIYFSSAKNRRLPEGGGQWPRTSISTEMRAAIPIPRIPIS